MTTKHRLLSAALLKLTLTLCWQSSASAQCTPKYWKAADDSNDTSSCVTSGTLKKTSHWAVQYPGQPGASWYNFDPSGNGVCCSTPPGFPSYSFYGWPLFDTPTVGGDPDMRNGYVEQLVTSVTYNCTGLNGPSAA